MSDKPVFGFGELENFAPKQKTPKHHVRKSETEAVDRVGENLGFKPRDVPVERRKRRGVIKPTEQFNIRAHIEDINCFIEYAERTNKSYRVVFSELVSKL